MNGRALALVVALSCALPLAPDTLLAQSARVVVHLTVVDPVGGVLPGATVSVARVEATDTAPVVPRVTTTEQGVAIVEGLVPGRYRISAEFPGLAVGVLPDVRLGPGENRHVIVVPLATIQESATADRQAAAAGRRPSEFGLNLSSEQVQALADDPAELARQLAELGGPDAVVRVDSFEGQQLPPKAQIKSIHVTRDQFAAEVANPGSTFVDVITQPGVGPIRGTVNLSFRDGSMNGRSRFAPARQGEQIRNYGGTIGGALVRERTSFSLSVNGQSQYITPTLYATLPEGIVAETLSLRQESRNQNMNALVDHAITRDQTIRVGFQWSDRSEENLGVGNFDLPERAWSRTQSQRTLRLQEAGPIGRRTFLNTRVSYGWLGFDHRSASDARTVIVTDAFTRGGAQQYWDVTAQVFSLASDLDHVRGIHGWRTGVQIEGLWFDSFNKPNLNGTVVFSSPEAYAAGQPVVYTQSLGTPTVDYYNLQGAWYIQDDIRVRRGLTLSPGVRYSVQKRIADKRAFAPRFGFTWAPSARGTTTVRGSVGVFHGFMPPEIIEQTLRMNGENQREIVITDPETLRAIYAGEPVTSGETRPTNRYLYREDFALQRNLRYSAGVDQVLSPRVRLNVLYNYIHVQQQPRGRNLNAPVDGVRPDPTVANVVETVTDAEIRRHELSINAAVTLAPPSQGPPRAWFNWRRLSLNAGYSRVGVRNNSAGPWAVSPSGKLEDDWGPGPQDAPYRVQVLLTSTQVRNVTASVTYAANSGSPYTWTTGFDDNQDGFVNDRPSGVGLRTLRGDGQQTVNLRVAYAVPIGPRPSAAEPRYRLQVFVSAQNLTNRQNLGGYSGVATSPNFMQPTYVINPRKVDAGLTLGF
jgi:hypothetical protein